MPPNPATTPDPGRDQRWAWAFAVFIVAGAIVGQVVGYGISAALGYAGADADTPPLWAALVITIPALAISIAPGLAALYFGVRAGRQGRFSGYLAATIGALSVVFWVVITTTAVLSTVSAG